MSPTTSRCLSVSPDDRVFYSGELREPALNFIQGYAIQTTRVELPLINQPQAEDH